MRFHYFAVCEVYFKHTWRLVTTPWSTVLVKLIVSQLAKNFSAFYETLRFITVLFWAIWIQSIPLQPVALHLILLWSCQAHPVSGCRFLRSHRRIYWETTLQKLITSIPNFLTGEGGFTAHKSCKESSTGGREKGATVAIPPFHPPVVLRISIYIALWRRLPCYRVAPFHAFTCTGPAPAHRTLIPGAPSCRRCFCPAPINTTDRVLLGLRDH